MRLLGLPFNSIPSEIKEIFDENAECETVVRELAVKKVCAVVESQKNNMPPWVLGADTLITIDAKICGKPLGRNDAGNMLRSFSGREHQVWSAIALYNDRKKTIDCRSVQSAVSFAPLSGEEIDWYLDSGEWQGAAGAYKIQGLASCFISGISGSYSSIVGLPLREFYVMLRDNGYYIPSPPGG